MANKFTKGINKLAPGYFSLKTTIEVEDGLKASDYPPFDPTKHFVGLSVRRKLLCSDAPGPAEVSGVPIRPNAPEGWLETSGVKAVVLNTPTPRLTIVPSRYHGCDIFIHPDDVLSRCEFDHSYNSKFPEHLIKLEVSLAGLVHLHAKYGNLKFSFQLNNTYVYLEKTQVLTADEWNMLEHHIFNGQPSGTYAEVVPIKDPAAVWFEGLTTQAVLKQWGVQGTPTCAYKGQLGFLSFEVIDRIKAKVLYPILEFIKKAKVDFWVTDSAEIPIEQVLQNPRLLAVLSKKLTQITNELKEVHFVPDASNLALLDQPLIHGNNAYISPAKLKDFFVPVRAAARTYQLDKIALYRVHCHSKDPENGNFILKQLIGTDELKDKKQAVAEHEARKTRLEAAYGELPATWDTHTDEDIAKHFKLIQRVAAGELIESSNSSILPERGSTLRQKILDWLQTQKMGKSSPVTHDLFIPNFPDFDELARLPGFLQTVYEGYTAPEFLKKLLLSDVVRSAAVADSI